MNRQATTKEEAAKQFEVLLARQFVQTMTQGLFKESLTGEEGPGWMDGQRETQRDTLTDVLTNHLVDSGVLHFSDLLLRQWNRTEASAENNPSTPSPDAPPATDQHEEKS